MSYKGKKLLFIDTSKVHKKGSAKAQFVAGKAIVPRSVKTYVRRAINGAEEPHMVQVNALDATLDQKTPLIVQLSAVALGDHTVNRTGARIEPYKVQCRVHFRLSEELATSVAHVAVRAMLVKVTRSASCPAQYTSLLPLTSTTPSGYGYLPVELPLNDLNAGVTQEEKKIYHIMFDRSRIMEGATGDTPYGDWLFSINKKLSGKTLYTGAQATDYGDNQYFLCLFTDEVADVITVSYDCRFWFKDG